MMVTYAEKIFSVNWLLEKVIKYKTEENKSKG